MTSVNLCLVIVTLLAYEDEIICRLDSLQRVISSLYFIISPQFFVLTNPSCYLDLSQAGA